MAATRSIIRSRRVLLFWVVFLAAIGAVASATSCLVGALGGNFVHAPSEAQAGLSAEARALVENALTDLSERGLVDYHVHLLGLGSSGKGLWVNPTMQSWWHPVERMKFAIYKSASGIEDDAVSDQQFVERLVDLVRNLGVPARMYVMAFDRHYDTDGAPVPSKTNFYVPNEYAFEIADQYPDIFVPVMSIHPYRTNALERLRAFSARGGRMVKWLPNAMGIDPADPRIDPFYDTMAELGVVLLSHAGEEQAVEAEEDQKLGNPLRLRRALDHGVKVLVAHCASLGAGEDLDEPDRPMVSNFQLFLRLMEEERYDGLVFGELSGLTQWNRLGEPLYTLLERTDLHPRLVNGSDYPLPAVNLLISMDDLEDGGYITEAEAEQLGEIYGYNPLLFDLVLRRTVKHPKTGTRLPASAFSPHPALP